MTLPRPPLALAAVGLAAILLGGCAAEPPPPPTLSCEQRLSQAANECPDAFLDQEIYADPGSGSMRLYVAYGGSFCPPDSPNYPCRNKGGRNSEFFDGLEETMHWIPDLVAENKLLKELVKSSLSGAALDLEPKEAPIEPNVYEKYRAAERLVEDCQVYEADKWIDANPGPGLLVYHEVVAQFRDECLKKHPLPQLP